MRLRLVLAFPCLLSGCVGFFPSAATYQPVIVKILDEKQFSADEAECRAVAMNYRPGFDAGSIASQAAQGAANNVAEVPISPVIPLAGALGGAGSAAIGSFDLNGQAGIKILVRCLSKETDRDGSAVIADPND